MQRIGGKLNDPILCKCLGCLCFLCFYKYNCVSVCNILVCGLSNELNRVDDFYAVNLVIFNWLS